MSALYLDGQQIGDDGRCGDLSPDLLAELRADRAEHDARGRATMDRFLVDVAAAGRRAPRRVRNARVRRFIREPMLLDCLQIPGVSFAATPKAIVAAAWVALDRAPARRWSGFGGESPETTLHALVLYGKLMQRREREIERLFVLPIPAAPAVDAA